MPTSAGDALSSNVGEATDVIGDIVTGVPAPLRKALGRAASRLVLGMVEVPANYLEARARNIKHRQAMREKLQEALTRSEINRLPEHPDLADRALEHHVSEIIGKQENREEVLREAVKELAEGPPRASPQSPPPDLDDDWLSSFSAYAEKATSQRMHNLFGRILAGEIRKPGSYSLFALDVLSKITKSDAELIIKYAPFVLAGTIVLTSRVKSLLSFMDQSRLGELGIVTSTSIGATHAENRITLSEDNLVHGKPTTIIVVGSKVVLIAAPASKQVSYECVVLTSVGEQLLSLHKTDIDVEALKELAMHFRTQGAETALADVTSMDESRVFFRNERAVLPPVPADGGTSA